MTTQTQPKRKLALILPAHNEEMGISFTIHTAHAAGMDFNDIFVVSDGSTDRTVQVALRYLPWHNALHQPQQGKAMAVKNGIDHFRIVDRYEWVHIADADGVFSSTYFTELKNRLPQDAVAATGHVQSLRGGWISKYRTFEYTLGLEVMRRIQAFLGTIPVIPGATCVLRTDIINELDFTQHSLTEDMDITLQLHRRNLGKIVYIPEAKAFTQDPKDIPDYAKQVMRWYRGAWQVMTRHKIGRRFRKIDAYMGWMILEEIVLLAELTIFPLICWWGQNYALLAAMFLNDLIIFFALTLWSAGLNRRSDIISGFPLFYFLRFLNLYAFLRAWYEIVVEQKFSSDAPGWGTAGRRYRIMTESVAN
jgi:cellulose synthase/poly-beta-1,6-N-acetylglucosamine synthase-like glycosyltransferase